MEHEKKAGGKRAKGVLISLIVTLIFGAVYFYLALPAINPQSGDFWTFLILLLGSALGLAWFHSDVDMPAAQVMVYRLITGQEPEDPRWITVPYIIGVAAGVAVFYALPSRSRSTPMEVKLNAYLQSMEQTEGKDVHDAR